MAMAQGGRAVVIGCFVCRRFALYGGPPLHTAPTKGRWFGECVHGVVMCDAEIRYVLAAATFGACAAAAAGGRDDERRNSGPEPGVTTMKKVTSHVGTVRQILPEVACQYIVDYLWRNGTGGDTVSPTKIHRGWTAVGLTTVRKYLLTLEVMGLAKKHSRGRWTALGSKSDVDVKKVLKTKACMAKVRAS